MSDRVNAQIWIGGQVKDAGALMDAINAEGLGPDWDQFFPSDADLDRYLRTKPAFGQAVRFSRHEVPGGSFDDLTAECERQGLGYVLDFDGYGGAWAPGRTIFKPGWPKSKEYLRAGDDGCVAVAIGELNRAVNLRQLDALVQELNDAEGYDPGPLIMPPETAVSSAPVAPDPVAGAETRLRRAVQSAIEASLPQALQGHVAIDVLAAEVVDAVSDAGAYHDDGSFVICGPED